MASDLKSMERTCLTLAYSAPDMPRPYALPLLAAAVAGSFAGLLQNLDLSQDDANVARPAIQLISAVKVEYDLITFQLGIANPSQATDLICRLHCQLAASCWRMGSLTNKRGRRFCSRLSISWGLGSRYLVELLWARTLHSHGVATGAGTHVVRLRPHPSSISPAHPSQSASADAAPSGVCLACRTPKPQTQSMRLCSCCTSMPC